MRSIGFRRWFHRQKSFFVQISIDRCEFLNKTFLFPFFSFNVTMKRKSDENPKSTRDDDDEKI